MATNPKKQAAIAIAMKAAGKKPKTLKKVKKGMTVKKQCPPDCGTSNSGQTTSPGTYKKGGTVKTKKK